MRKGLASLTTDHATIPPRNGCRGAWRRYCLGPGPVARHPIAILAYLVLSGGAVTVGCNPSIRAVVHLSSFSFLSLSAPSSTAIRARSAAPVVIEWYTTPETPPTT